ncbi:MAG TPA: hypothetical protein VER55_12275, partial [Ardenticatenaceae bacterium]|nr:hypothetical protein [Ardenticatenaceae bacterium]
IVVEWGSQQPTGNQILECFGPPESYSATHRLGASRWYFELDLVYSYEGLVVTLYRATGGPQPPAFDGNAPMTYLSVVRPGSAEAVLRDAYSSQAETLVQPKVTALKPWPDTWEEIVVEVGPLP